MSLKSRARSLSKRLGISHQSTVAVLRALGAKPADIRERHRWPLLRADAFAIDPLFDDEYRQVAESGFEVRAHECDDCQTTHFFSLCDDGELAVGSRECCPACSARHSAKREEDPMPLALQQPKKVNDAVNPPWLRRLDALQDMIDPPFLRSIRKMTETLGDSGLAASMSKRLNTGSSFPATSMATAVSKRFETGLVGRFNDMENIVNPSWLKRLNTQQDVVNPPAMKSLRAPTGLIAEVTAPFSTPHDVGLLAQRRVADLFPSSLAVEISKVLGASLSLPNRDLAAGLKASSRFTDVLTSSSVVSNRLSAYLDPFKKLVDPVYLRVAAPALPAWVDQLSGAATAWAHVGTSDRLRGLGMLSVDAEHESAALVWSDPKRTKDCVAAWLPHDEQHDAPLVTAEIDVICSVCGTLLVRAERQFDWKGPRKGIFQVSVFPACPTCIRQSHDDPEYWDRAFSEGRTKPQSLRVVVGRGQGDGVRRGVLRLVQDDRNDGGQPPSGED